MRTIKLDDEDRKLGDEDRGVFLKVVYVLLSMGDKVTGKWRNALLPASRHFPGSFFYGTSIPSAGIPCYCCVTDFLKPIPPI